MKAVALFLLGSLVTPLISAPQPGDLISPEIRQAIEELFTYPADRMLDDLTIRRYMKDWCQQFKDQAEIEALVRGRLELAPEVAAFVDLSYFDSTIHEEPLLTVTIRNRTRREDLTETAFFTFIPEGSGKVRATVSVARTSGDSWSGGRS